MAVRRHFPTRTLILAIACALISFAEAHAALYGASQPPASKPTTTAMPRAGLQAPIPAPVMPYPLTAAMVSIPVTSFKRTEDDQKNIVFEIGLKDKMPVTLTVHPSMLKAARPGSRPGLLPRSSLERLNPEACYFDGDKRFIDVAVTDFPAHNTRLYTISDRNYAADQQYNGVIPTISFQVITPPARANTSGTPPTTQPCELHILFRDNLPTSGDEPRWQSSADPETCHPWVKTFNPDAALPPGFWWPFVWTPKNPGKSVQDAGTEDTTNRPM